MPPVRRHEHEVAVDDVLVRRLLRSQFPGWHYYRAVPHLQANARASIEGALAD